MVKKGLWCKEHQNYFKFYFEFKNSFHFFLNLVFNILKILSNLIVA